MSHNFSLTHPPLCFGLTAPREMPYDPQRRGAPRARPASLPPGTPGGGKIAGKMGTMSVVKISYVLESRHVHNVHPNIEGLLHSP